jgi:hypothetical protein
MMLPPRAFLTGADVDSSMLGDRVMKKSDVRFRQERLRRENHRFVQGFP